MRSILAVSHGTLAEGVCRAAKMIYGDIGHVHHLCLREDMGIETFKLELSVLIDSIGRSDEIIILADLKGGSPYTSVVAQLSEKGLLDKSAVISGLNLPMMLAVLFLPEGLDDSKLDELILASREGIDYFQLTEDDDSEL